MNSNTPAIGFDGNEDDGIIDAEYAPYDEDVKRSYGSLKWLGALAVLLIGLFWWSPWSASAIEPFTVEEGRGIQYYVQDHDRSIDIGEQFSLDFMATPMNDDALANLPDDIRVQLMSSPRAGNARFIGADLARDLEPHLALVKVDVPVQPGDYFDPENGVFEPSPQRLQ